MFKPKGSLLDASNIKTEPLSDDGLETRITVIGAQALPEWILEHAKAHGITCIDVTKTRERSLGNRVVELRAGNGERRQHWNLPPDHILNQ